MLTDERIDLLYGAHCGDGGPTAICKNFARAIEAEAQKESAAQIEALNLAVRYESDLCQQALESRKELERKLAEAWKDGIVLVPIEPTEEMRAAARKLPDALEIGDEYRAMIAAAPKAEP